jgi:CheY-like chemotaxis protein
MSPNSEALLSILIADDDPDDCMLFEDAIGELDYNIRIQVAKDGEELLRLLRESVILPEMLFLDLNMPRKNGFQCLAEIRADPQLSDIFIAVYSTTANQKEIDEVFRLGANTFIRKPNSYTELKSTLHGIFRDKLGE